MIEVQIDLKQAVEARHGGTATFVKSVPVHLARGAQTIWNGAVQVFDLTGSPTGAARCYAWSMRTPDGERKIFALLHNETVAGPREAVRAAIGV